MLAHSSPCCATVMRRHSVVTHSFAAVCPDGAAIALDLRAAASLIMLCPPVSWLCSQYLDRIGELYFGLQAPKGMLEELLSAFK